MAFEIEKGFTSLTSVTIKGRCAFRSKCTVISDVAFGGFDKLTSINTPNGEC